MKEVLDFLISMKPSNGGSSDQTPEAADMHPEPENGVGEPPPASEPDWQELSDRALEMIGSMLEPRLGYPIEFSDTTRKSFAACAEASGATYFSRIIEMVQRNMPVVLLAIFSVSLVFDIRRSKPEMIPSAPEEPTETE